MEEELQALLASLRQGQTAQSGLPTMNAEMAEAKALRGQPLAPIDDRTGFMSPLQAIAGMINQGKSSQDIRQLKPQIAAANQQVGDAAFGEKAYGLKETLAKEKTRVSERKADALAKTLAAEEQRKQALLIQENNAINAGDVYENTLEDNAAALVKANEEKERIRLAKAKIEKEKYDAEQAILNQERKGHKEAWYKKSNKAVQLYKNRHGTWLNTENDQPVPTKDVTFTNPKAKVKGGGKGGSGGEDDPMNKVADPDLLMNTLTNPLLGKATGWNPQSFLGSMGLASPWEDDPEMGPKTQAIQKNLSKVGIDQVKTNLEGLGVNPTDKDLDVAFASLIDARDQPLTMVLWVEQQYLPNLEKAFNTAIENGDSTPEIRDSYLEMVRNKNEEAKAMWAGDTDTPNEVNTEQLQSKRENEQRLQVIQTRKAANAKRRAELMAKKNQGGG